MNKKQTVLAWTFSPSFYYYLTASLNMKGKGPLIANNFKRRQAGVKVWERLAIFAGTAFPLNNEFFLQLIPVISVLCYLQGLILVSF